MPDADLQQPDWLLQMENILETLNEGVVITDEALHVVFANEAELHSLYQTADFNAALAALRTWLIQSIPTT